jgi:hypothetical protein
VINPELNAANDPFEYVIFPKIKVSLLMASP